MGSPKAGKLTGFIFFLGLQFFEEGDESLRIISAVPEILGAQLFSMLLILCSFPGVKEIGLVGRGSTCPS